jgi:hypothetical protein
MSLMLIHLRLPSEGKPAEATTHTEPRPFFLQPQLLVVACLGMKSFLQIMQVL